MSQSSKLKNSDKHNRGSLVIVKLAVLAALIFPTVSLGEDSSSVVYSLYKDYGWVALFSSPSDAEKFVGHPITEQPINTLEKYFDTELSMLLLKDEECNAKVSGELCLLEFDPLYGSQDTAAYNLKIVKINETQIRVQYVEPSNHKTITLNFFMIKRGNGWRISDIQYPSNGNVSLRKLLQTK